MSWDIKIGDGDHRNSAHRVDGLSCKAGVSSNGVSYWVSDAYLGLGIVIMKDCVEGEALKELIDIARATPNDVTMLAIDCYMGDLVIEHAPRAELRQAIDNAMADAYQRGGSDRAKLIRDSLGVTELLGY